MIIRLIGFLISTYVSATFTFQGMLPLDPCNLLRKYCFNFFSFNNDIFLFPTLHIYSLPLPLYPSPFSFFSCKVWSVLLVLSKNPHLPLFIFLLYLLQSPLLFLNTVLYLLTFFYLIWVSSAILYLPLWVAYLIHYVWAFSLFQWNSLRWWTSF